MKSLNSVILDPKTRSCLCSLFVTASLIFGVYFIGSAWLGKDSFRILPGFGMNGAHKNTEYDDCKVGSSVHVKVNDTKENTQLNKCEVKCRPFGGEALPKGIVSSTSNLEMRPLWGPVSANDNSNHAKNLLAIAVGIKQKELANHIVEKFLANDFVVMLFHYDGVVDEWNDFNWYGRVIHVSATNQTKWWFAKRFLHPDIIAEYEYIFLWDEDLGVKNFHPGRYLSIIKEEDLEISQPALDPGKSEVHHHITARRRRSKVHRRYYKLKGGGRCDDNSTAPPCVGWVEMMAPVFSRAAWRCAWYMVQNDLIHAWGLDMQLGYCAQGDRMLKVGVVDAEYIVHLGLPTLGGLSDENKLTNVTSDQFSQSKNLSDSEASVTSVLYKFDNRSAVRRQSYIEMRIFRNRWNKAVKEDTCWVDLYPQPSDQKIH
ncbi:unnamed protein product [Fraxinus pennsylvanica]|uniref:Uncharacterized protein n=1 Tax=Fraxinus pennsylvanica TaxID=56036 RepID=A0AAD1ZH35_9LAMI|nr:unnamed protein product [Fraxinus pennsylvanica]